MTSAAVVLSLLGTPPAQADTSGTPPNIIDYNTVAPADQAAVVEFEQNAAREVLTNHSLPITDYDAVRGWARNQIRTQMWADLVVIIKKAPSERTANEQAVYDWFQSLVQESNKKAAQASIDEFIKYAGLTADNYTTAEPVSYNNPDKNLATGGYCVYRAPGPYVDEYTGWLDQTCYTSQLVPLNFLLPMPTYDQFITYGQYQANKDKIATPGFANTSFEVAASLSVGASLAVLGAALPIAVALSAGVTLGPTATAIATAVFPFAARAGTLVGVAVGAAGAIVGTAIFFIVTVVLASIEVDAQLRMGQRLKDNLDKVTNTPPDLRANLQDDEDRAKDATKSAAERKPKYYPGFFTTFLTATLPEADPEPCSGGLVIGGGVFDPGCINSPAVHPVAVDDPVFSVTQDGSTNAVQRRWISHLDPDHGRPTLTRASGKGWFVQVLAGATSESQSLALYFKGWDGKSYYAERIWDAVHGYRFAVTPVHSGAKPEDATVTEDIQFTQPDDSLATARIVPSSVSSLTVNIPDLVHLNEPVAFSAVATGAGAGDLGFTWYFPRLPSEPITLNNPEGVPQLYTPVFGATVSRAFDTPGAVDVYLVIGAPDGTRQLQRHTVNVIDGRQDDAIRIVHADDLRVGINEELDLASTSGAFVQLGLPSGQTTCGMPNFYTMPHVISGLSAGTCTVIAHTTGSADFKPVELQISIQIFKGEQSITGGTVSDKAVGEAQQVTATATSGLPVAVSVDPQSATICHVSGTTVTADALGTCDLTLSQAGDADYLPAVSQSRSFLVNRSGQTLTFDPLADIAYRATQPITVNASSGLPVTVSVDAGSAGVCSLSGTTVTADALGTCSLTATQPGDSTFFAAEPITRNFQVVPAPLTITATDETVVYGGSPDYRYTSSDPTVPVTGVTCSAGSSPDVGAHPISCSGGDAGPNYTIGYVAGTLTVTPAPATVTVTPPTVQYSDPVPSLQGRWTAGGLLNGDTLSGALSGCTATGLATSGGAVTSSAGVYPLTGCAGLTNPNYDVAFQGSLVVTREDATIEYTGGWYFTTGGGATADATLSAKVSQAADGSPGDLTKARVDFLLFASTNLGTTPDYSVLAVPVDASGLALTTFAALPANTYHLVVRLDPANQYFAGPLTSDELAVYQPVPGASVSGGGWVLDGNAAKGKGHFAMSVRYNKQKQPQGQVSFSWRNPANGYDYVVRSNSWVSGGLALQGSTASLSAKAVLTVVDPATGAVVTSLSGGNYAIRVVATDGGQAKTTDTFAVTVKNPSGVTIHSVGVPTPAAIGGGNVAVSLG